MAKNCNGSSFLFCIKNREQRLQIFDNLFELSPVMETYAGKAEPKSLNEFKDKYKRYKDAGVDKEKALGLAGHDALVTRGLERQEHHMNKAQEYKKGPNRNVKKWQEEMHKSNDVFDRSTKHAKRAHDKVNKK